MSTRERPPSRSCREKSTARDNDVRPELGRTIRPWEVLPRLGFRHWKPQCRRVADSMLGNDCRAKLCVLVFCGYVTIAETEGCPAKGLRYCWQTQRSDPLNLIRIMPAKGRV